MIDFNYERVGKIFLRKAFQKLNRVEPQVGATGVELMDFPAFMATDFKLTWLVKKILVAGQPAIIGGHRKTLKTTMALGLAISLASGKPFLDKFAVPDRMRVAVFSGESGGATLQETVRRICRSMDIANPDKLPIFVGLRLPRLSEEDEIEALQKLIRNLGVQVVIIDPLYLCLMGINSKINPASIFEMGPLLARISSACLDAGATPILVHHFRKWAGQFRKGDDQNLQPPEMDDLQFAGIQEFMRQWMLFGRREKFDPDSGRDEMWMNVGGSAGFSSLWALTINQGKLRSDFSGRHWRVAVHTSAEARAQSAQRREADDDAKQLARNARDSQKVLKFLRQHPQGETKSQIKARAHLGNQVGTVLDEMVEDGALVECTIVKAAGNAKSRSLAAFRLPHDSLDEQGDEADEQDDAGQ
jgi:hypothetical protein